MKKKPWSNLSLEQARIALGTSVHFYSKATNSNAAPAGVRLPASEPPVRLPYVAFSTSSLDRYRTTYTVGAPKVAPFNQCMAVIEGTDSEVYLDVPPGQREVVLAAARELDKPFSIETIDPRLRQLLLPDGAGSYVALTPLHSDPFSAEIGERLRAEKEAGYSWRRRVDIGIGGSKPQNVGRRTRALGRLMHFSAPKESPSLRRAMSMQFNGVRLQQLLPIGLITDFAQQFLSLPSPAAAESLEWREFEVETFRLIAAHVLQAATNAADAARSELDEGAELGGGDEFIAKLLTPDLRDKPWRSEFARRLVTSVESFQIDRNGALLAADGRFAHLIQYVEQEALN